jgi:transposase
MPWNSCPRSPGTAAHDHRNTQLRQDEAAVQAALQLPWSNRQAEGQITRLKLIKRQMFGRAKHDLLRARVLQVV